MGLSVEHTAGRGRRGDIAALRSGKPWFGGDASGLGGSRAGDDWIGGCSHGISGICKAGLAPSTRVGRVARWFFLAGCFSGHGSSRPITDGAFGAFPISCISRREHLHVVAVRHAWHLFLSFSNDVDSTRRVLGDCRRVRDAANDLGDVLFVTMVGWAREAIRWKNSTDCRPVDRRRGFPFLCGSRRWSQLLAHVLSRLAGAGFRNDDHRGTADHSRNGFGQSAACRSCIGDQQRGCPRRGSAGHRSIGKRNGQGL